MKKTPEEVKKGIKAHENHDCKSCPYDVECLMRDPRIDPDYSTHILEDVQKCRDALIADMAELMAEQEERIAIMSESGGRSVIGQVDSAIKAYKQETGANPAIIIANVPAWDAMEKEAQKIAKPAPVNYATFRGIRVYKAADGYEKPRIRLARDVKLFDIEGGE